MSLEQRLDDLEATNALLSAKVAAMEPRLCQCGWEGQPIIVEDGEVIGSSPSSYQTLPVASLDENQEPFTGGKGALTQHAHGEFIVSSETIRLPNTQQVHGEYFLKVPTCLPQFYPPGPW